jgi:hypothetical protein
MDKDFQGFAFVLFEPNRPAAPLCCNRKYITLFSALDFVIKKCVAKKQRNTASVGRVRLLTPRGILSVQKTRGNANFFCSPHVKLASKNAKRVAAAVFKLKNTRKKENTLLSFEGHTSAMLTCVCVCVRRAPLCGATAYVKSEQSIMLDVSRSFSLLLFAQRAAF